ncbi:MAG: LPS export ABC transporter periplasmic protein LptC [Rhodanobacteraceae bacterium]|jgi:lipopolysaccharide export system protein LptC|nr:LPS export ABC transporter periplasmic protein LptC [Rhodanobacteraceae bacterium]
MTERRTWLAIALLALLAIGTEWLLWLVRERPNEETFAGPPRSDYALTDFTLDALDSAGQRTFQVSGPHLARRGDDGSIYVTTPDYLLIDGGGHPWKGKSDAAWVDKDGSLMKLQGQVEMHRAAGDDDKPIDVVTRDLTARPKDKTFETAAPATITQPGSILSGVGMRGDLNDKVLELLSDVHSTLQPQRAK